MFCSQCGTQVESGARFCGKCGHKLPVPAPPGADVQARQSPPPVVVAPAVVTVPAPSRGPRWLYLIGGAVGAVVLIVAAILGFGAYALAQMEEPVQAHLEAIRQDDLVKAYALTSKGFQESVPEPAFKLMAATIRGTLRNSTFVAHEKRALDATQGIVRGALVNKKGEGSRVDFTVAREEDGWKVHAINLDPDGD